MFYDEDRLDTKDYTFSFVGAVTDDTYAREPRCLLKYGDKEPVYILRVQPYDYHEYASLEQMVGYAKKELESPYAEDSYKQPKDCVFPSRGTEVIFQSYYPFHWENLPHGDEPLTMRDVYIVAHLSNAGTDIVARPRNIIVQPEDYKYEEPVKEEDDSSDYCDDF